MFYRIFILLLLFPTLAHSSDLRILSMNTCMLPKPIKETLQEIRQDVIPAQLENTNYDLLIFEEAFTAGFHHKLISKLKKNYPFNYYLGKKLPFDSVFGSGVFVMSRYPIKILKTIHYKKCAGVDCYASKGAVVFEVRLPSGKVVQVAGTHLNSHGDDVKLEQFNELKKMFKNVKQPGVPQILVGDLNSPFGDSEFSQALEILGMSYTNLITVPQVTSGRVNDCYKTPRRGKWLDHVLIDKEDASVRSTLEVVNLEFNYDGKVCPSSDHQAVEANLYFN